MSRIEKTTEPQKTTPIVRDEVVEKYADGQKKTRGRFSCLGIALMCFVILVGFVLWQVAATGLMTIPVFSSVAYTSPQPVRSIVPGTSVEQLSQSIFTSTLTKRLLASGGVLNDRSISLSIPESSLTATLQNELKKTGEASIDAARAQIAVLPEQELELFLPIRVGNHDTALTARVSLVAHDGLFDLKLVRVRLGTFQVPGALIASMVQPFVNRELTSLNQSLSTYMHVDSLTTQQGVLNASGTFTVQVKK